MERDLEDKSLQWEQEKTHLMANQQERDEVEHLKKSFRATEI